MSEWTEPEPDDPESIKTHLDELIRYWREKVEASEDLAQELMARCNLDSFQTIRKNIFGETLEGEGEDIDDFEDFWEERFS